MTDNNDEQLRVEALSQAVRVSLSQGDEVGTVERAQHFHAFLAGREGTIGTLTRIHAKTLDTGRLFAEDWQTLRSDYQPVAEAIAGIHKARQSEMHAVVAKGEVTDKELDRAIRFVLTGPLSE